MRRRSLAWPLAVVAVIALAVFVALTVVVTTNPSLALDSRAFRIVNDVRAPWLDHAARIVTALGLIAIVGPVLLIAAALLTRRRHHARATALATGAALTWISVWIVKTAVHRARPPAPLGHTSGQSYPSAHAANSVGWLALATALTVAIPTRRGRITMVAAGALLAALVGLSRIYLRAHYASDVLAREAVVVAMYALAAIGSLARQAPHRSAVGAEATASRPPASRNHDHATPGTLASSRRSPPDDGKQAVASSARLAGHARPAIRYKRADYRSLTTRTSCRRRRQRRFSV